MYPELFTVPVPGVGEVTITSFGVMMALSFLVGYYIILLELRRRERDGELASDILLGAIVGGIVGAKLYWVFLHWERTLVDPFGMLFARGGLTFYGGLIGGLLGVLWVVRRRRESFPMVLDAAAPALAMAYGLGRIGCFLVGDDYGKPTDSWVGIAFPDGLPPTTAGSLRRHFNVDVDPAVPDHEVLAVHPTQLYEAGLAFLIFLFLWRLRRHPHQAGWLFSVWMVLAGLERLFIEVFRAKDDRWFGPFTVAQLMSVLLIAVGVWLFFRLKNGSPRREERPGPAARRKAAGA